ncbi:Uncharacterised protein [Vibrio cholerae]|nr:Uncharacterised protein [Vibrio cholerae]
MPMKLEPKRKVKKKRPLKVPVANHQRNQS